MKLYNTLTRKVEEFSPIDGKVVTIYSCGPTVYDQVHIGNLSSFIYADTLRRAIKASGYEVKHVMNFTDVDDKTIKRSTEKYPNDDPKEALAKLTQEYSELFLTDMKAAGNDVSAYEFIKATDAIPKMQDLIRDLYNRGFAYIADDGVYFSIEKYKASGKRYGQLLDVSTDSTSESRIDNDEYDKDNAHDFALWKKQKPGEPAWNFEFDGRNLAGRPGWHIECSAMSAGALGQPFDIHTGGVDLIFPHHENEIAQSTAGKDDPTFAKFFVHNEHILVDGKKMSKSLNNFITLQDIMAKGYDPLAFRLLVLQSHYRSQAHFSWENLDAAQNRLKHWREGAAMRWQEEKLPRTGEDVSAPEFDEAINGELADDLNIPGVLQLSDEVFDRALKSDVCRACLDLIIEQIDQVVGIDLMGTDITSEQKALIATREEARANKDWQESDELRNKLEEQGVGVNDTPNGTIWYRL